ncbi:MAG: hypothetical protein JWM34_3694 [Ilumatobacteraceae bacterium]|nr:hypothetical protein [Ilumatobacteraceae bacterium]
MPRTNVTVTTPDGECPALLSTPDGDGPWPAVILFMDAGGVRPSLESMADGLAAMGYVAFLPNMYYRSGPFEPFDPATAFTDPEQRARLGALMSTVTKAAATSDTGAFLDYLAQHPQVAGTAVGTTGYCMGGGLSLTAAGRFPDRVAAAASFHGGNLASDAPDSPHLLADQIRATVYVAAAANDHSFPPEQAERLETALFGAGVAHTIETYEAAHGFAVTDMPTYDPAAEMRHWQALGDLYAETLGS